MSAAREWSRGNALATKQHPRSTSSRPVQGIRKTPTGIDGFDEITFGGLPSGRVSLVSGGPGSGKTLFSLEFIVRGARDFGEPGVFMAFEESEKELIENVKALGFELDELVAQDKVLLDFVYLEPSEFEETGEFDLEGLFVRLDYAIKSVNARRVVLDTVESLFAGLPNEAIVRAELRRLFRWLKERGVTAIVTGERGETTITRYGLEEYVSDCVVVLDHRVDEQVSTRRLRVAKYRGSSHGSNEFPFLIGEAGLSVLPITMLSLVHKAHKERVSTGIPSLDEMLEGKGYYKGTTVLVTGTAGTGKTSLGATFVDAACARGEKAIIFAFEEGPQQLARNMKSIGIDLDKWVKKGLLKIDAARPTTYGLETHLARIHTMTDEFQPSVVVLDPITNFLTVGSQTQVVGMLARIIDFFEVKGITALFTNLTTGGEASEGTSLGVSSLMDSWILIKNVAVEDERRRVTYVLKSRGMAHSSTVHELVLSKSGIELVPVTFEMGI